MAYYGIIKCTSTDGVNVRENPSINSTRLGGSVMGDQLTVTDKLTQSDGIWYKVKYSSGEGYVYAGPDNTWWSTIVAEGNTTRSDATIADYMTASYRPNKTTTDPETAVADYMTAPYKTNKPTDAKPSDPSGEFVPDTSKDTEFTASNNLYKAPTNYYKEMLTPNDELLIKSANSILGMPFSFLPSTDAALPGYKYGRMFCENIILNAPIATIIAGSPKFLKDGKFSDDDKKGLMNFLVNVGKDTAENLTAGLTELLDGKSGRYFSFETQHTAYMVYVNTLCRLFAQYLGINHLTGKGGREYEDVKYENSAQQVDGDNNGSFIDKLYGGNQCINVYFNPQSSLQESNSNQTGESKLAGMVNSASDLAKEAQFVLGAGAGESLNNNSSNNTEQSVADISDAVNNSSPNLISRLIGRGKEGFNTVLSGANMIFPEIWKNSSFSRSYQLEITLSSPYGDPESVFLHVLRPLAFLIALGLPRQYGPNGFTSPFIIQAFSKGMFNVELNRAQCVAMHI